MLYKAFALLGALLFHASVSVAFTNPIKARDGSDPFMVYDDGYYYLTSTTWSNIQLTRATTIAGLKTATPKVIWRDSNTSRSDNLWAPEIHWLEAERAWFFYYTAGSKDHNLDNQRVHAIKGSSTNLWDSTWEYAGRIDFPGKDEWSIDATVLFVGAERYIVYSTFDGDDQCLYIARMTSATTVEAPSKISTPTLSWEIETATVNEGPVALYHEGRTFIVYSASACWGSGYALGRLELTGSDPLSESSWTKYEDAIFQSANGVNEPGHNGFFLSPSGNQTWNVYHASTTVPAKCDGSRYTAIQPVTWNSDGTPNLGAPRPLTDDIPEPV